MIFETSVTRRFSLFQHFRAITVIYCLILIFTKTFNRKVANGEARVMCHKGTSAQSKDCKPMYVVDLPQPALSASAG